MKSSKVIVFLLALLFSAAQFSVSARAEEAKSIEIEEMNDSLENDIVKNPLKPPDTSSPRATLRSFLANIDRAYAVLMDAHRENIDTPGLFITEPVEQMERRAEALLQRSMYCLNLSEVPEDLKQDVGFEGAIMLKEIFDRIEIPAIGEIPDARAVETEEEQEKVTELNNWRFPNTEITISMVEEGPRTGEFLFAPKTVERLNEFYGKVKDFPYKTDTLISHNFLGFYISTPGVLLPPKWSKLLPAWSTTSFFKLPLWQWFAVVVLPLGAVLIVWMLARWWHPATAELSSGKKTVGWILVALIAVVLVMLVQYVLDENVNVTGQMLIFVDNTLKKIIMLLMIGLVLWELLKARIKDHITEEEVEERSSDDDEMGTGGSRSETLLLLFRKFLMVVVFTIVALLFISSMGINITPLLAGAGVIGLAVGFGSQKLVSDAFSGIFFLIDDAFRVGEYIEASGVSGTVEAISLRNVMLRHHRGMLQIVPFSDLGSITNYMRGGIIVKFNLQLPYDTDINKVRKIIKKVGQKMMQDEQFAADFIKPIKSQGVKSVGDSVMTIRVKFTAKPGKQFLIRREAFRLINEALAAKGIYFAHRKVIVEIPNELQDSSEESMAASPGDPQVSSNSTLSKEKLFEAGAAAALDTIIGEGEEEESKKKKDK